MRIRFRITTALATASLLAGCGVTAVPTVGPNDIPALEAAVQEAPDDADQLTLLGVAYYDAARYEDAVRVLARVTSAPESDPVAHLYFGLAHEELRHWQQASDAYAAFLAGSPEDDDVREDIEQRLVLVQRELMQEQLRAMLDQEAALANRPAQPRTVAVFPFRIVTDDPRYAPLQFALADMVTTDLGIPGSLQLLERTQIQALVQEMALSLAGYTDPSSAARVGRLMRAEHVVQGSVVLLGDERLRMEMAVVDPAQAERAGEAADEIALEQIFDAEKQLVLRVLNMLGVTLTAAEREAIEENRTGSLLALLAYGEGLGAMDRGDFAAASAAFQDAASIDPGFQAAQVRGQQAAGLQQAAQTSGSQIAAAAQSTLPGAPAAVASTGALLDRTAEQVAQIGSDLIGDPSQGDELAIEPSANDPNANAGGGGSGAFIPFVIDNPNQ